MFLCRQCPKGKIIYTRIVEPMHYLKNRIKISWNQWNVEHHCLRTLPGSFGIYLKLLSCEAMLSSGTVAENSPASARGPGLIPGWGDPPEKGTAAHSSVLAWEIPGTEEPCGPQFINGGGIRGESQRVGHDWEHIWLTVDSWISDPGVYDAEKDLPGPGFSVYRLCVLDISVRQHWELPTRTLITDDSQGNHYQLYPSSSAFPLKCTLSFSMNG